MKVIDLLNKIANGKEVPKKIKYNNIIWVYNISNKDYAHPTGAFITFFSTTIFDNGKPTGDILIDEVEIIEEEKEIEAFDEDAITLGSCRDKINELVREINKLKRNLKND